jgi:hypothetical protein
MRVKKMIRKYYQQKLNAISKVDPIIPTTELEICFEETENAFSWQDVIGWGVIIAMVVHYFLTNGFFEVARVMPSVAYLF